MFFFTSCIRRKNSGHALPRAAFCVLADVRNAWCYKGFPVVNVFFASYCLLFFMVVVMFFGVMGCKGGNQKDGGVFTVHIPITCVVLLVFTAYGI